MTTIINSGQLSNNPDNFQSDQPFLVSLKLVLKLSHKVHSTFPDLPQLCLLCCLDFIFSAPRILKFLSVRVLSEHCSNDSVWWRLPRSHLSHNSKVTQWPSPCLPQLPAHKDYCANLGLLPNKTAQWFDLPNHNACRAPTILLPPCINTHVEYNDWTGMHPKILQKVLDCISV